MKILMHNRLYIITKNDDKQQKIPYAGISGLKLNLRLLLLSSISAFILPMKCIKLQAKSIKINLKERLFRSFSEKLINFFFRKSSIDISKFLIPHHGS